MVVPSFTTARPLPSEELEHYIEKIRQMHIGGAKINNLSANNLKEWVAIESLYTLYKSSNRLEKLTYTLIGLTILLSILTLLLLIKEFN